LRDVVRNALRKRNQELVRKLREDFSLGEIEGSEIDLSLIDGFLSEYAEKGEDSVSIVRLMRDYFI